MCPNSSKTEFPRDNTFSEQSVPQVCYFCLAGYGIYVANDTITGKLNDNDLKVCYVHQIEQNWLLALDITVASPLLSMQMQEMQRQMASMPPGFLERQMEAMKGMSPDFLRQQVAAASSMDPVAMQNQISGAATAARQQAAYEVSLCPFDFICGNFEMGLTVQVCRFVPQKL